MRVRLGAAALLLAGTSACDWSSESNGAQPVAQPPILPTAAAGETPRCYEQEELRSVTRGVSPGLERDVLVLVDQTTALPEDVAQSVLEQVTALAAPGTRLSLGTFSSYTESAHSRIDFESAIEPAFPEARRDDAPMRALRKFDECLDQRKVEETERLRAALEAAIGGTRPDVPRSDILANLKSFAGRLAESPADEKVLVLVSDLLENSSSMSFYGDGAMRRLDPAAEVEKAAQNQLVANLEGVRVFIIGAGLLPPGAESARSLEEVRALEDFWESYLEESGAEAVKIGKPRLLSPIR